MPRLLFAICIACTAPVAVSDVPLSPAEAEVLSAGPTAINHIARVRDAFPPPPGAVRLPPDDFGAWLQQRDVFPPSRPVRTHDGRVVSRTDRVVDFPVTKGDLQQCADTAIRLRAEWARERGQSIAFHATSGDLLPWERFAAGEKPVESRGRIVWEGGSDRSWEGYLRRVFMWAGSASLERLDTISIERPVPGALLVEGGFPGHVVVLFDVAETPGGDTYVLVGEGFMPAQDLHIQVGPEAGWWRWDAGLQMPHWSFAAAHLRAFRR